MTISRMGMGLVMAVGLTSGCANHCKALTERLCQDLGPEDCAAWQALGGPNQVVKGGRGANKYCGVLLNDKLAYDGLLHGARGTVIGDKIKKAAAAGDYAKLKELSAQQKEISAQIQAGVDARSR